MNKIMWHCGVLLGIFIGGGLARIPVLYISVVCIAVLFIIVAIVRAK